MSGVSEINPLTPIWPTRRDEQKPKRDQENAREEDPEKDQKEQPKQSDDGHIDEYA